MGASLITASSMSKSVSQTASSMSQPVPVYRSFCTRRECQGLTRHFAGTCLKHEEVVQRRRERQQKYEEGQAAHLKRQAGKPKRNVHLNKKIDGQSSEVSTCADDDEWTAPLTTATNAQPKPNRLDAMVEKEVRKLEKTLREIAKIEEAIAAGKKVDQLQYRKVATKEGLVAKLTVLKV